jgi:small conductance mechanosensitive channel
VGFALQETLANFAAGMMILFYRPYDVGDFVEVSGVFGKVSHMSLVSTTILTIDNQTLVVPNGKIWGDVIRNVTSQRIRRVDLTFGISYSADIPRAENILMSILESHDKVLSDPEPMVRLHQLGDSSVDFVVRPWVKTDDYWEVHWDVTREVKMRFDAEGISIPFPQRDVHHYVDGRPALPRESGEGGGRVVRPAPGLSDDPSPPDE